MVDFTGAAAVFEMDELRVRVLVVAVADVVVFPVTPGFTRDFVAILEAVGFADFFS